MVKEIDLRRIVNFEDKQYIVVLQLFEKRIPIYSVVIYDYISEKWHSIYSEYYSKIETAVERQNYIINNISEFIERN